MPKVRTTLALVLVTLSLSAAALPEPRLISVPDLVPAAYRQEQPAMVWDGEQFLAVWTDQRKTAFWRYGHLPSIYATRIDGQGKVLDSLGIELVTEATSPRLASHGTGSLLTYADRSGNAFALPLGQDARPSGPAVALGGLDVSGVASNGLTYCVVASRWPSTNRALILGRDGRVQQTFDIEGVPSAVVFSNGRYIVISVRGNEILASTVVASRPVTVLTLATIEEPQAVAIASTGRQNILVAWLAISDEGYRYQYLALDANGVPTGIPVTAATQLAATYGQEVPTLGWDGNEFLLSWQDGYEHHVAMRIGGNDVWPRAPFSLGSTSAFASAFNGSATLFLSVEGAGYSTDLFARSLTSFRDLLRQPVPSLVAVSARPQMQPAVATAGSVALAVSVEGEGPQSITATLYAPRAQKTPVPALIAWVETGVEKEGASVAALDGTFLVAWREMKNFATSIKARRVSIDGTLIGDPFTLAQEDSFVYFGETSIATDGQAFLVAWDSPTGEILARRVALDGTVLGSAPLVVSRSADAGTRDIGHPEALWTGSDYLVAWSEHERYTAAPPAGRTSIRGARLTSDGTLLDTVESRTFFSRPAHATGVELAANDSGLLVVGSFSSWIDPSLKFVDALPLDRSSNPTASQALRLDLNPAEAQLESPAAVGAGSSFVVFWSEQQRLGPSARVHGVRLTEGAIAQRYDAVDANAFGPTVARLGNDVVLVQSQHDRAGSNVVRLFSTTFDPAGPPAVRKRAVRP